MFDKRERLVQMLLNEEQQVAFYVTGMFATVNRSEISTDANMPSRIDAMHRSQHILYLTG